MISKSMEPVEILLVEDNEADVRLTIEALKDAKLANNMHVAKDGVEALEFLRRQGEYAEAKCPHLVLLDLNLPRKNGQEVLEEIKDDPDLRRIPVVILTASQAEEDIIRTYNLHANCYIQKPIEFKKFIDVIDAVQDFWFSIVKLPPNGLKKK